MAILSNLWNFVDGALDVVIDVGWNIIAGPFMLIMYAFGHLVGWLTRDVLLPSMSWQPFQILAVVVMCFLPILAVFMIIVCFFEILKWLITASFVGLSVIGLWSVGRFVLKILILLLIVPSIVWLLYRLFESRRTAVNEDGG